MDLLRNFPRRSRTSRRQKNRRSWQSLFQVVELLEERMVLSGVGIEPNLLFAPGTPQEYVDQFRFEPKASNGIAEFRMGGRFNRTATDGGTGPLGDAITITWSILPDGVFIQGFAGEAGSSSNLVSRFRGVYGIADNPADTNYQGEAWFEAIQSAMGRWGEVSGVNYVYEPSDDGASFANAGGVVGVRGDVRIGGHTIDGNSGTLAYNFFPDTADMVIDTADSFFSNRSGNSLRLRNVVSHEAGHGLGLSHVSSNNAAFLLEPFINLGIDGPQLDDILGVQRGYGDKYETGTGNNSVGTATGLGTINASQTRTIGRDATDTFVAATDTDFVSIDDHSDVDVYSFSVAAGSQLDVTLTPQGPTYNEGPQGGRQRPLHTSASSDLTLEVIGTDGTTVLATANNTGLGGTETLSNVSLTAAGTYFVRVSGANNAVQLYELGLGVTQTQVNPGVTITQTNNSTDVTEGGNRDRYTIVLDSQPAANVTITIGPDNQLSTSLASVTFMPANWNLPRTVVVAAVDDADIEGNHTGTIRQTASSPGDSNYNGISVPSVIANITDNDIPGVTIVQSNGSTNVSEDGATDTYTIVLDALPSANVTITINPNSQLTTDLASVTFTPLNWNSAQTVTVSAVDDNIVEGNHRGKVTHTASSSDSNYNGISVVQISANIRDNDTAANNPAFYFSLQRPAYAGGIVIRNEDIVAFDGTNFSVLFDGSDVGLAGLQIDAFDVINDTDILLSFSRRIGVVDDSDIILFRASSLGDYTAGRFYWYFDASDVGLSRYGEDVDAVTLLDDGSLLISTVGPSRVPGLRFRDEDLVRFIPSRLGRSTRGSFEMFLDGSDANVGLSQTRGEDIDGLAVLNGDLYLTTVGNFSVPGISGRDEDVFVFDKSAGIYNSSLFVDFSSNDVTGLDFAGTASRNGLGLGGAFGTLGFDPLGNLESIGPTEFTNTNDGDTFRFFPIGRDGTVFSSFVTDVFSSNRVNNHVVRSHDAGRTTFVIGLTDDIADSFANDDEFDPGSSSADLHSAEFDADWLSGLIDRLFSHEGLLETLTLGE